ncbi:sigma-70 family RNA polymerase sigma factor [Pedobacter frigoris]|uniref:RNA polymerase sigma factor RpoD/SigA n=1 Tax=Pedobacter frigoris TaxID=2571272 RepID=A0A4V5NYX4_9SPHI|nr:RNA polymerase sigma factor RpoD/SigA [Pedobacter frigoris]TKC05963.1 RNA polymerase sigma factor RpoD/SigA [Pedobacter frigoris]
MRGIIITQSVTEHNPILDRYLADIAKYDLLKPEEEVLLSDKARNGDQAALHKLVNANLRFVVSVAKKYRNAGLSLEDLIAEGNRGLIKAAGLFDASRGFKFISFAVWWIRQSIIQAIDEKRRVMRLPLNVIIGINNIRKAESELEQRLERQPTLEEVSEVVGMTEFKVVDHLWHSSFASSLDKGIDMDSGKEGSLIEVLEDKNASLADEGLLMESRNMELERLLSRLPQRDGLIVRLSYGIGTGIPMESEDVAVIIGLSQERVRQIKLKAVKRLKEIAKLELFY